MSSGLWRDAGAVGANVLRFRQELATGQGEVVARGPAYSSLRTLDSHAKYFQLFAEEVSVDEAMLGGQCSAQELPERQQEVEDVLMQFLWYAAKFPRTASKRRRGDGNSIEYAISVVSLVRAAAERRGGRQVGTAGSTGGGSARTRAAVATLFREGPQPRASRRPIQRKHLLRVKSGLKLGKSAFDRACWAVVGCAWFEAVRVGDPVTRGEARLSLGTGASHASRKGDADG